MALLPALPDDLDAVRALVRHVVRLPPAAAAWDFDPAGPTQLWTRPRDESDLAALQLRYIRGFCQGSRVQVFEVLLNTLPQQVYSTITTRPGLLQCMMNYVHEGAVYEQLRSLIARAARQDEKRAEETLRRLADRRFLHILAARAVTSGDIRAQPAADLVVAVVTELLQQVEGERLLKCIDDEFLADITRPLKNDTATREELEPALTIIRFLLYYGGRKLEEPASGPTAPRRELPNLLEPHLPALRAALMPLLPGIARRLIHPQQQPKPAQPKEAPPAAQPKDAPVAATPTTQPQEAATPAAPKEAATPAAPKEAPAAAAVKSEAPKMKKPPATMVTFSAYKVREPFSSYRFALLGVIMELARKHQPEEHFFDKLDVEFWRALVAWFFDYPHNNMLHCLFFRLFSELVRANHEPSLRALLSKGKFLSRMITAYNDKSIDSRSFILAMANMLRLTAASLPHTAFLADFLRAHEQWKSFLPILLAESMAEQPRVQVAGTHPITPQLSPAWRRVPSYNPNDGLDLGSSFSKALGFGVNVSEEVIEIGGRAISESDDTAPRRLQLKAPAQRATPLRQNARIASSTPAPAAAPAPAAPPPTAPTAASAGGAAAAKKKKKKKKKAAAGAAANSTAAIAAASADEDDGEDEP